VLFPPFYSLKKSENFLRKFANKNPEMSLSWTSGGNWSSKSFSCWSSIAIFLSLFHLKSKKDSILYLISMLMLLFPLNLWSNPKNLVRLSPSSRSSLRVLIYSRISIKLPIIYEKIATPKSNMAEQKILSNSLLGLKSPNPTVVNDVNE